MLCETIVRLPFGRSRQSGIVVKLEKNILFPAKKFVLSMIVRIFAAREPAKPLNDAQMCGSFLFLYIPLFIFLVIVIIQFIL